MAATHRCNKHIHKK